MTRAFGEVCWWGCSEGHEKGGSECEKQIKGYKEGGVWGRRGWECESKYELRKGANKNALNPTCRFWLLLPQSLRFLLIRALSIARDVLLMDTQTVRNGQLSGGKENGRDFGLENAIFSPLLLFQDK